MKDFLQKIMAAGKNVDSLKKVQRDQSLVLLSSYQQIFAFKI